MARFYTKRDIEKLSTQELIESFAEAVWIEKRQIDVLAKAIVKAFGEKV
ncbi:hypothetical protein [Thermospira aquatica]|uniref:Uncharacterized protein n=1 Tax=Thermospira aquatica TaxID=2828656 RepID=A0AAX3BE73_9SPIR|nr:hypothetical protein [Thermospira aquatica]URA10535.1 hypothetical protein KDW03_01665 [Thermospira aquatica]